MKISESLQSDYFQTLSWKQKGPKTLAGRIAVRLADALQQAVAENLELTHTMTCSLRNHGHSCSTCCTDWLAAADKLLRGEK